MYNQHEMDDIYLSDYRNQMSVGFIENSKCNRAPVVFPLKTPERNDTLSPSSRGVVMLDCLGDVYPAHVE